MTNDNPLHLFYVQLYHSNLCSVVKKVYLFIYLSLPLRREKILNCVKFNLLDCDTVVNRFKLQQRHHISF